MNGSDRTRWLAPAATPLSLVACSGTLAVVVVPGARGIGTALNEAVWAGAIVVFAVMAEAVLLRWRRHRQALRGALAGVAVIAVTMFVSDHVGAEIAGVRLLCAGTVLDWRVSCAPAVCEA